jgi:hypothetical protein
MERYYDAFLYLANWGSHLLSFRVPSRLLDLPTAELFCVGDAASARVSGEHLVIDVVSETEEPAELDWGGEGLLASIAPARAELVAGDLRLLYLAWLLCVQERQVPDENVEPPLPSGLGTLTASLKAVAEFMRTRVAVCVRASRCLDAGVLRLRASRIRLPTAARSRRMV